MFYDNFMIAYFVLLRFVFFYTIFVFVYTKYAIMGMMDFNVNNYSFELGEHKDKNVIWIVFPYNHNLINTLK